MVSFHPDSRFLTDFAAGSLPLSEAVCVAAHLEFCPKCRSHVQQLGDLAAQMMARLEPETADDKGFDRLMARIDAGDATQQDDIFAATPPPSGLVTGMPRVVQKLSRGVMSDLRWVQLGRSLRVAPLSVGNHERQTAIYDIKAGGRMPEHEHRGEEITVLLKGSFSDADGKYVRGDFVVRHEGERHQPTATLDTDCLCLVSLAAPIRPSSWLYRAMEPLINFRLSGA